MKRFLFICIISLLTSVAFAQSNVTRSGNTFTQQSMRQTANRDSTTNYTFKDNQGKEYPVYKSINNKLYVWRESKNGNKYKFYIKED